MTPDEPERLIQIAEVIRFLRRSTLPITAGILLASLVSFKFSGYIPRSYKSKAVLTIHAGYFHHPLASDVLAETQETSDRNFERVSLIRLALNESFLTEFATKYFPRPPTKHNTSAPVDTESILKNIDYFATNPTSFHIAVTTNSPETALNATEDVLEQIISTITKERYDRLIKAQQSMIRQAELLSDSLLNTIPAKDSENLDAQRALAERKLNALEEHLAENHPDVVLMRNRLHAIRAQITRAPSQTATNDKAIPGVFFSRNARTTSQEIFDDLLKKISNLGIILAMEQRDARALYLTIVERPHLPIHPTAPNRAVFALIGAVAGLVSTLSFFIAAELRARSAISAHEASNFLGIPLLAEIPNTNKTSCSS